MGVRWCRLIIVLPGVCHYDKSECGSDEECKVILGPDTNAAVIAREVYNKLVELTGGSPHLIIRLH